MAGIDIWSNTHYFVDGGQLIMLSRIAPRLVLFLIAAIAFSNSVSLGVTAARTCYVSEWTRVAVYDRPRYSGIFQPGPGVHYYEFKVGTLGEIITVVPMWRELDGKGWHSWGPYAVMPGRDLSITLKTGDDVSYRFSVQRFDKEKVFTDVFYRTLRCVASK